MQVRTVRIRPARNKVLSEHGLTPGPAEAKVEVSVAGELVAIAHVTGGGALVRRWVDDSLSASAKRAVRELAEAYVKALSALNGKDS